MQSENSKNTNSTKVADQRCLDPKICNGRHKQFDQNEEFVKNAKEIFKNQRIKIVNTVQECKNVVKELRSHCAEYNVLGFDCEWVSQHYRRRVALLQLASYRGLCALIRLSKLKQIPKELRLLLEDKSILKVGIQPHVDERYLIKDYAISHVASTLDLRYLAKDSGLMEGNDGLRKLSEDHLKVQLNKNRCMNSLGWEDEKLLNIRIEYAAKDVHASILLFNFFQWELKPMSNDYDPKEAVQAFIEEYCVKHLNKKKQWAFNVPNPNPSKRKKPSSKSNISIIKSPIRNLKIHIVSTIKECQTVIDEIKSHCNEYNVLGYKTLTVQSAIDPAFEPFDILQLATHRGLCAMFYLKHFNVIPVELKNLLLDKHILKVGVRPIRQKSEIHVISTFDLNYLLNESQHVNGHKPIEMRFSSLSTSVLDVKLNKTPSLELETIEKNYGTNDAHIGIEIFKKLTEKMSFDKDTDDQKKTLDKFIKQNCFKYLDIKFEKESLEFTDKCYTIGSRA